MYCIHTCHTFTPISSDSPHLLIAWKRLLCWWEPSNKLEGLHCSALTLSKAHSTTTQGFGHEFGHRGLLSHLFGRLFLVGKYQAKPKKHWRSEGDPTKPTWERIITILQPEPNTLQKMKANISWDPPWSSYIALEDPSCDRLKSTKMWPYPFLRWNLKIHGFSMAHGVDEISRFDKKPSGPLVDPPISYLSSLLVVAFVEYLGRLLLRCWWLKDWRTWRAGILWWEATEVSFMMGSWESGIPK